MSYAQCMHGAGADDGGATAWEPARWGKVEGLGKFCEDSRRISSNVRHLLTSLSSNFKKDA